MSLFSRFRPGRTTPAPRKPAASPLGVEALEDRCVPALLSPLSYPDTLNRLDVGDFNNDGVADIVGTGKDALDGLVIVRLGNGDGTFREPLTSAAAPSSDRLVVGDFTGDGKLDVVTQRYNALNVLSGNGDGTFQAAHEILFPFNPLGGGLRGIDVGDLNNDGRLDLVAAHDYSVRVLLGNGDGSFGDISRAYQTRPDEIWARDFDEDGNLDALVNFVGLYGGRAVELLLGNGDGTFLDSLSVGAYQGKAGTVADLNGDGHLDFVAVQQSFGGTPPPPQAFLGNGDGPFQAGPPGAGAAHGTPGDLNRDGNVDVVVATGSSISTSVGVILGNGDGTFRPAQNFLAGAGPSNPVLADFNGDGFSDVAARNYASSGFSVLLNDGAWDAGPPPPPPPAPSLSIGNASVTEGNTGSVAASFTVTLSAASAETATVAYSTSDGSAVAGGDYQAASGTLTFAPGETSKTVLVLVNGDRVGEPNETFFVNLSGATNATIADGQGIGTIVDDEPRLSINDVTKAEGRRRRTTLFTFTVTLSAAYDQPVTVSFRTVNGTATTSNGDYVTRSGTLTFAPGATTMTITIEVKGDSKREANETFYLDLFGNSSNSLFTKNRGIGTILNDD